MAEEKPDIRSLAATFWRQYGEQIQNDAQFLQEIGPDELLMKVPVRLRMPNTPRNWNRFIEIVQRIGTAGNIEQADRPVLGEALLIMRALYENERALLAINERAVAELGEVSPVDRALLGSQLGASAEPWVRNVEDGERDDLETSKKNAALLSDMIIDFAGLLDAAGIPVPNVSGKDMQPGG